MTSRLQVADDRPQRPTGDLPSEICNRKAPRTQSYVEAVCEATDQEMARDPAVIVFGLDVDDPKAIQGTTRGLVEKYGPERVFGTPLSEDAMTGAAIGMLSPLLSLPLTVKGLIVTVIGGLGSIPGAIIAGLLVGGFENVFQFFRGVSERDLYVMLLLFAFLVFRPGGMFQPSSARD